MQSPSLRTESPYSFRTLSPRTSEALGGRFSGMMSEDKSSNERTSLKSEPGARCLNPGESRRPVVPEVVDVGDGSRRLGRGDVNRTVS